MRELEVLLVLLRLFLLALAQLLLLVARHLPGLVITAWRARPFAPSDRSTTPQEDRKRDIIFHMLLAVLIAWFVLSWLLRRRNVRPSPPRPSGEPDPGGEFPALNSNSSITLQHVTQHLDTLSASSFFVVYDGHEGPALAKYCAKQLHSELRANEDFHRNIATALENPFLRMDVMLRHRSAGKELSKYDGKDGRWRRYEMKNMLKNVICCAQKYVYEVPIDDGCTACVALIRGNRIIVANAGVSRCVISRDGQRYVYGVPIDDGCTARVALIRGNCIIVENAGDFRCVISRDGQAIALSTNQKPNIPAETQRIQGAWCQVTQERGDDLRYKDNALAIPDQAATSFPEVHTEARIAGTKFLVIACDGIWDCMTDQEVTDCIQIYTNDVKPAAICVHLPDHCLSLLRGIAELSRADCLAARRGRLKRDAQAAINLGVHLYLHHS